MFAQQWLQSLPQKSWSSYFSWNSTQPQLTNQQLESGLSLIQFFNTSLPSPMKFLYCTKKTNPLQKIHARLCDDVILRGHKHKLRKSLKKLKHSHNAMIFFLFLLLQNVLIQIRKNCFMNNNTVL